MAVDELALRRAKHAPRVAGHKRVRSSPPAPVPGDASLIVEDLRQIKGMTEEVMAEALALGDPDVITAVGALILHINDAVTTAEQAEGGE